MNIGKKIKEVRKQQGMTQQQVADRVGTDTGNISRIERGQNVTITLLHKVSKALNVDLPDLVSEAMLDEGSQKPNTTKTIKLADLSAWTQQPDRPKSIVLEIEGDSMVNPAGFPSIPPGSRVTIDTEASPQSGDIVAALIGQSQESTIKKLQLDGPNTYLKPLNPDYRPILENDHLIIVGVATTITQLL